MSKAVAYAKILGTRKTRTPNGDPVTIASAPFEPETTSPQHAIAQAAAHSHGIVPHLPNWTVIGEYEFTPQAKARYQQNTRYERVFVLEHVAERAMRKHLNISNDVLDPMKDSWYLVPASQNNTNIKDK